MIPKNRVIKNTKLILSVLFDFPAVNKLKSAVKSIVIGIKNSTTFTLTAIIPKTERINATVCPIVKSETKSTARFQSLNEKGTASAIKNNT